MKIEKKFEHHEHKEKKTKENKIHKWKIQKNP
jgi:hypothetical protein